MNSSMWATTRPAGRLALVVTSLATSVLVGIAWPSPAPRATSYQYLSPMPGSRLVSRLNNVVIRDGDAIERATVDGTSLSVVGSKSGRHEGDLVLSDDSRTLVFEPHQPFAFGETVVVTMAGGPRTVGGRRLSPVTFSFSVASRDPIQRVPPWAQDEDLGSPWGGAVGADAPLAPLAAKPGPTASSLPPGYPTYSVLVNNAPDPGYVFISPRIIGSTSSLTILDNNIMPIFYRHASYNLLDFKLQPNGQLTYFDSPRFVSYALDSAYAVVDSFAPTNGYVLDFHDLQIIPNGHCLLLADETMAVGMDTVVAGGNPDAMVQGFVIQELDAAKHVVFQWRTFDHYKITDAVNVDLTASWIDAVHMNSVELDTDGNLLVSAKHLNEVTKINHQTGDIIWRLGKNAVNNQFTFVNDPRGFGYQHDARRLPNGHITLFDNANFLNPQTSRAVEYALDEQAKVATLVWEADPLGGWGSSNGSVQRRSNGSTMVCWGAGPITPRITDYHADGSKALELDFFPSGTTSYRAFRWPWSTTKFVPNTKRLDFGSVRVREVGTLPLQITNHTSSSLQLTSFVVLDTAKFHVQEPAPITIPGGGAATIHVQFRPDTLKLYQSTLYVRSDNDSVVIAQDVVLEGTGVPSAAAVDETPVAEFALTSVAPNPARGGVQVEFTVARESTVRLSVWDVQGRLVAVLADGTRPAGRYHVTWDGRAGPQRAPSGIYLVRYESPGKSFVRHIALLK